MNVNYQLDCGLWRTAEGLATRNDHRKHYDFAALCEYPIILNIEFPHRYLNIIWTPQAEVEITAKFKSGFRIPFIKFNIVDCLLDNGYKKFSQFVNQPQATCVSPDSGKIQSIYNQYDYKIISSFDIVTSFEITIGKTTRVAEVLYQKNNHLSSYEIIKLDINWDSSNKEYTVTRRVVH